MSPLKNILGKKDNPIQSYSDFWNWFLKNERDFFEVIKEQRDVEKNFINKLSPKLDELREGYLFTGGMYNEDTAKLTITADGSIKNIVFAEEIVQAAPEVKGWKIIALKQPIDDNIIKIDSMAIEMDDYKFIASNLHFYANEDPIHPDEIDITIIYDDYNEEDESIITSGVYIYLEHYLGELNFATVLDNINIISKTNAEKELIPILKLKDYLIWREKEFVEKYSALRHSTENDEYSGFEAELEDGSPVEAIINTDLLSWDSKASHPWIATIQINYSGDENSGMPDEETANLLEGIENSIGEELHDFEGYLNIARETVNNTRTIFFACKDFRKPSKVFDKIQSIYSHSFEINFDIYKDKYWGSLMRFDFN